MKKYLLSLIAITMIIATTIQAQIPTNGLVAWYPFTGNAIDSSGNGNNGTVHGATLTTDRFGNANSAYNFRSGNYIVSSPNLPIGNAARSLSVWFLTTSLAYNTSTGFGANAIMTYGSRIGGLTGNRTSTEIDCETLVGYLFLNTYVTSTGGSKFVSDGKWHSVIYTFNGSHHSLYLDGVLSDTANYAINTGLTSLYFGQRAAELYNHNYVGKVDDARVYNRELTFSEVQSLYHEGGYDDTNSIPRNGLVAWYPFTGNTLDSSGNNNHGTNYGATLTTDRFGKVNSAYSFNGSGNYINVSNSSSLKFNGQITVSTWVKPNSLPSPVSYVLSKGADGGTPYGYEVILISNGSAQMDSWDSTGMKNGYTSSPANSIQVNKWNHILFKYDGTYAQTYVNGVLSNTAPVKNSIFSNAYDLKLGKRYISGLPYYLNGNIDDIAIYNRALDSTEVQELYHYGGFSTPTTSITSFYPTIGTTNTTITIRGNSFTGASTVNFGGVTAKSFTVVNDSTITAFVGNGASGDIVVICPNGTATVGGFVFTNSTIPTNGLIAWYPFTGNTLDSSGNNNHGTNYGATLTTDRFGNANSAYSFFDGVTYITADVPKIPLKNASRTISGWFKTPGTNTGNIVKYGDFGLYYSKTFLLPYSGYYYTPRESFDDSNWHFFTYTHDNSNCSSIYFDGKKTIFYDSICTFQEILATNSTLFKIGGDTSVIYNKFTGSIDDIRIYNRVLDSAEIQTLYKEGGYKGNTLPILLAAFEAKKYGNSVIINWSTSKELNNGYFIIQHSKDGTYFTDITNLNAIGNGANGYHFTDISPYNGINYYRLKSVDKDGSSSFSKVVSCQLSINNYQLTVFPNPANSKVTISGSHIASVQLLDNLGRVVKQASYKDATNPVLSVSGFTTGVYHVRIQTADGKFSNIAFIKE